MPYSSENPFGSAMSDQDIERLLTMWPFNEMDPKAFSAKLSLQGILRNDTRIVRYQTNQLVVREGDYGSSAFLIMSGSVNVFQGIPLEKLGRRSVKRKGLFASLVQLWRNPALPEVRGTSLSGPRVGLSDDVDGATRCFMEPHDAHPFRKGQMTAGNIFGEVAPLTRAPRTATVIANSDTELLEIRWQGLRILMQRVKEFKEFIHDRYRERGLRVLLREMPIFQHLSETEGEEIFQATLFHAYGDFEWTANYQNITQKSSAQRLEQEPIIVQEGTKPPGLMLVLSGFARVSKQEGAGHHTVSFLSRGDLFGLQEIIDGLPLEYSLRALGYVDVLSIPSRIVEQYLLPRMPQKIAEQSLLPLLNKLTMTDSSKKRSGAPISTGLLEFLVEERFINGAATMIIDLDRCTRCDECVSACATTHENNPRFIRNGKQFEKFMVTHACMHCLDPVCLIGCPTGAIHRDAHGGQVVINDVTCIGCGTCANACPYQNIQMIEARTQDGKFLLSPQKNQAPILRATKCDLCIDQLAGPACQQACPHDALIRIDMRKTQSLANWVNR